MKKALLFAVLFVGLFASAALAGSVTLAWDPVNDPAVTGYKIHYGTASKAYTVHVDAKNVTTYTIASLTTGQTYFFAATAYAANGIESAYSNEVSYTVPVPAPGNLKIVITITP